MAVKHFSKEYLVNELDLPYTAIYEELIDSTRWSLVYKIVFEESGKFYQTTYSVGATECQEERPWEYINDIECKEVELKEVVVEKWVEVKDE